MEHLQDFAAMADLEFLPIDSTTELPGNFAMGGYP